jgi:hypothetical protein
MFQPVGVSRSRPCENIISFIRERPRWIEEAGKVALKTFRSFFLSPYGDRRYF